ASSHCAGHWRRCDRPSCKSAWARPPGGVCLIRVWGTSSDVRVRMPTTSVLTSTLAFAMVGATERAAAAAFRTVGRGVEPAADAAAFAAMHAALAGIDMAGKVVIGSNNREGSHLLAVGEAAGTGRGPEVDLALDPLEGTTQTVKAMENALSVL